MASSVRVRLRVFQTSCHPLERRAAIPTIMAQLRACDESKVALACFPEGYLTGYASDAATIARYAVATDSTFFLRLLEACSTLPTTLILGFLEKMPRGYANSAAVISKGNLLGCYRKIHTNEQHFIPGTSLSTFHVPPASFGVNICYDANFSAPALALARQGAQIIFYPLNNLLLRETANTWRSKSPENLRQRAKETGCWIASADVVGTTETRISYGCTQIVAPDGSLVAAVAEGQEGFATAIFELPSLIHSR